MTSRTRQQNDCPAPAGSCSHPDICQSHGCAALQARARGGTTAPPDGRKTPYQLGYEAGVANRAAKNPWDGRTTSGREWKRGWERGVRNGNERSRKMTEGEPK